MTGLRRAQFRSRRGFSLTELLFCLPMIGIAGLLAVRLFGQSMHTIQTNAQDPTFQLEQMGQTLRIDAWAAKKPEVFPNYFAGTWGPECAEHLLERWGHTWRNDLGRKM